MGDPACWLDQVCPACGGFLGEVRTDETTCDRCGRRLALRDGGPVVVRGAPARPAGITIRAATPAEWTQLREVRLAALADTPRAFASTHAEEVDLPESTWRARTATSALAFEGDRPVGLVGAIPTADGRALHLVSTWVAPSSRGRGIGRQLVEHVLGRARDAPEVDTVVLWVAADNAAARSLYERCGFRPTGEIQPLPSHPDVDELRMSRPAR